MKYFLILALALSSISYAGSVQSLRTENGKLIINNRDGDQVNVPIVESYCDNTTTLLVHTPAVSGDVATYNRCVSRVGNVVTYTGAITISPNAGNWGGGALNIDLPFLEGFAPKVNGEPTGNVILQSSDNIYHFARVLPQDTTHLEIDINGGPTAPSLAVQWRITYQLDQ